MSRRLEGKKKAGARSRRLDALLASALAVPGLAVTPEASAQTMPDYASVRLQYSFYQDYQSSDDRIRVHAPMVGLRAPVAAKTELQGSFVLDTISGASPLYLDTLSGASGIGVKDDRYAGDLRVTQHFERFSIGAGAIYSTEDDYESRGGILDARVWSADKNTTFNIGVSGNADDITSSNDATLDESRNTVNLLAGVTQVLDPRSMLQSNVTYTTADGYQSDPYKTFDNRPRSRDQAAWLTRYVVSLPGSDSSLHLDYRFSLDGWGVIGHMAEAAYYKNLGDDWLVKPNLRYYTQSSADFFTGEFPPPRLGAIYTADQRLSAFGSITIGGMILYRLPRGVSVDVSYEFMQQRESFRPGGGTEGIEPFYAHIVTVGITKDFK